MYGGYSETYVGSFVRFGPGDGGALTSPVNYVVSNSHAAKARSQGGVSGTNSAGQTGVWVQTSYVEDGFLVIHAKFTPSDLIQAKENGSVDIDKNDPNWRWKFVGNFVVNFFNPFKERDSNDKTIYATVPDLPIGVKSIGSIRSILTSWRTTNFSSVASSIRYHFSKHVLGHDIPKSISKYTDDAVNFFKNYTGVAKDVVLKTVVRD